MTETYGMAKTIKLQQTRIAELSKVIDCKADYIQKLEAENKELKITSRTIDKLENSNGYLFNREAIKVIVDDLQAQNDQLKKELDFAREGLCRMCFGKESQERIRLEAKRELMTEIETALLFPSDKRNVELLRIKRKLGKPTEKKVKQ